MALSTHTETNGKLGLIENFIETLLPADWGTWDLDRQLMFWSSGFGPEQKGTVTALGKLEDSLEKLEPKTFFGGYDKVSAAARCISSVICGSSPYQP